MTTEMAEKFMEKIALNFERLQNIEMIRHQRF
jgi:hypothetical protein